MFVYLPRPVWSILAKNLCVVSLDRPSQMWHSRRSQASCRSRTVDYMKEMWSHHDYLQNTFASLSLKFSLHTVPHTPLWRTWMFHLQRCLVGNDIVVESESLYFCTYGFNLTENFNLEKARVLTIVLLIWMSHCNPFSAPDQHFSSSFFECFNREPVDILITVVAAVRCSIAKLLYVDAFPAWTVELTLFTRSLFNLPRNNK